MKFKLIEDVYDKNGQYNPSQDSKYKRLLAKPINKLSVDDIAYLYTIHFTQFVNGYNSNGTQSTYWYANLNGWDNDFYKGLKLTKEIHSEEFQQTYEHFSKLEFPLKVYRALREKEDIPQGSGSMSWTTDINLFKANNSIFKNCTKIVEAKITADMIQNEYTIVNYVLYSAQDNYGRYPENEITLKPRFKNSKLIDLHFIDKNDVIEKLNEELYNLNSEMPSEEAIKFGGSTYMGIPLKYVGRQSYEAECRMDYINISDKFFEWPENTRRHILNHEIAHIISSKIMKDDNWSNLTKDGLFLTHKIAPKGTPKGDSDFPDYWIGVYGDIGSNSLDETITECIVNYFEDPEALKRRNQDAYNYIDNYFKTHGYEIN